MAENITIKERIERQIVSQIEAVTGIGDVERWEALGNKRDSLTCYVIGLDEQPTDDGVGGDSDIVSVDFDVRIALLVAMKDSDTDSASLIHNRWLGKLEAAIGTNDTFTESDTSEVLANWVMKAGTSNPPVDDGQPEFYVILDLIVTYDHYRLNPYAGPGVTVKSV